jgi:hypothetical protein
VRPTAKGRAGNSSCSPSYTSRIILFRASSECRIGPSHSVKTGTVMVLRRGIALSSNCVYPRPEGLLARIKTFVMRVNRIWFNGRFRRLGSQLYHLREGRRIRHPRESVLTFSRCFFRAFDMNIAWRIAEPSYPCISPLVSSSCSSVIFAASNSAQVNYYGDDQNQQIDARCGLPCIHHPGVAKSC